VLVAAAHPGGLAGLPAHDAVDDRLGDTEDQQHGRGGVAGVVESPLADAGGLQQVLPPVVVGVGVERLASRRREHVPLLHPQVSSCSGTPIERLPARKHETQYEVIPPTGIVNLNRDNHVVICGPRLSPIVAQVLEGDDNLRFEKDRAWHLLDQRTGEEFRSPMDEDGSAGDFGYLGRLPRLDGRGTFLYIAGIHAIGANGVVHYLEHNLAELYREVRTRPFSTLISCRYNPETLEVLESRRVTPLYRHEG
jgi:hypothetical protein